MMYEVEPFDLTKSEKVVDPRSKKGKFGSAKFNWWLAQNDHDLAAQLLSTADYLKKTNAVRIKQASIYTRLFCGKPLNNFLAATSTLDSSNQLPIGRPTANVVYSCTDTLVSRISQDKPSPTFLTDGGNYKERRLAKEANSFIQGEFFRGGVYDLGPYVLRDSCVVGNGFIKVFPRDDRVTYERTLETELLTDYNDSYYGNPRELIQLKLVDRSVFMELFPEHEKIISGAAHGNVDNTPRSAETVADQFIIAEGWHLKSGEMAKDGRHVIACSGGIILDEGWDRKGFPFAKFGYNPNIVGWFAQGLAEILMPTQMELYRLLIIASQSIELMGVPRVLMEEMSKIMETSFNNKIGSIIKYRNTAPEFVNAQANHPEIYSFIQWLIQNAYQISGISALSAGGAKPQGLNSGEALRKYDQIQDDRFSALRKRYQNLYPDLAYLTIDCAKEISETTGKNYKTTFPDKYGTREVDFKSIGLLKDTYVIQCFEESFLPKDPAGRQEKLSEMLAMGEITTREFRRLSNFPDLQQVDELESALEERILKSLDAIIDDGQKGYKDPDPFILDPSDLATKLTVQYINKYSVTNLEDEKMDLLMNYFKQIQDLKTMAVPPVEAAPQPQQGPLPVQPPNPSMAPTSGVQV